MSGSDAGTIYLITVQGRLKRNWAHWLNGMALQIVSADDTTMRVRVPDQAALRGLMNKLWDLNLILISVSRQAHETNTGEPDENQPYPAPQ